MPIDEKSLKNYCGTMWILILFQTNAVISSFRFQEILINIVSIADLRGHIRRLLKVEGTTLNHLPIARSLGMTDQQCNQVLLCWESEDNQMEEILVHWQKEQDNNENPFSLRDQLKELKYEGQLFLI